MTEADILELESQIGVINPTDSVPASLDDTVLNFITFADQLPGDTYVAVNVYKLRDAILEFRRNPSGVSKEDAIWQAGKVRYALAVYNNRRSAGAD